LEALERKKAAEEHEVKAKAEIEKETVVEAEAETAADFNGMKTKHGK
jgi:hypothetical protein